MQPLRRCAAYLRRAFGSYAIIGCFSFGSLNDARAVDVADIAIGLDMPLDCLGCMTASISPFWLLRPTLLFVRDLNAALFGDGGPMIVQRGRRRAAEGERSATLRAVCAVWQQTLAGEGAGTSCYTFWNRRPCAVRGARESLGARGAPGARCAASAECTCLTLLMLGPHTAVQYTHTLATWRALYHL